ncbi:MAG: ATP-binding protein [Nitrospiraceae bacterium]
MSLDFTIKNRFLKSSQGSVSPGAPNRYQLVLLHSLVAIVLCYQLLFSRDALLPVEALQLIALGLIGSIVGLVLLPTHIWTSKWVASALVMGDTVVTTAIIYLSGNASSSLYVTYFLIMLIAAFAPTLEQMIGLSVLLCSAYGAVLYVELNDLGSFGEGHLLQIPILLILAIFYGVTNEAARKLTGEKSALLAHINERKRAEQALRESEERYRRLVEVSPDAIFITKQNRIVFMNSTGFQLLGATSPEQVIGRSPFDFFHPEYDPVTTGRIRQVLERGESVPLMEEQIIRLDGIGVAVEIAASPFTYQGFTAMQVVLRNISERKQLEEQLSQSQKMEAVGQLAGGVAHDFNNMLTIITGHGDLLVETTSLSEDQRQSIEQIRLAAKRAASLTTKLLAFSRRQMLRPKVLDLNAVAAGMEQMLRPLLGVDIDLVPLLNPSLGHVKADPGQLEQVIINLSMNAQDAMPQGGRLTLETDNVELDEAQAQQHIEARAGQHVMLAVSDTGIGMDTKTQSHIFEPFFTTKPKDKGTGLGLSTVYGIVKQSGGFICVESVPGRGTSFKIYLPRVEAPLDTDQPETPPTGMAHGSETVLIAEDEPGVLTLVCETLRAHGYTVLEARNGKEALAVSRQYQGRIHLLLTDVVMPQMNGREVSERLLLMRPDVKVLYMSGYTDDTVLRHGVVADGVDFLQKPFTPGSAARTVRKVLDGYQVKVAGSTH